MTCQRADHCTMAPKLDPEHRILRVLRSLYCSQNPGECARVKFAPRDRDVPPDMMPNGWSTAEVILPDLFA
jgi:hypothetical protein